MVRRDALPTFPAARTLKIRELRCYPSAFYPFFIVLALVLVIVIVFVLSGG